MKNRKIVQLFFILLIFSFFCKNCFADLPKNPFIDKYRILGIQPIKDRWIAKDKYKHFVVSAFLMGISYNMFRVEGNMTRKESILVGCSFSFSLGIFKEWKDSKSPKNIASLKDLAVDILGIGLGILCFTDHLKY